ncbi:TPA: hypothetical protein ENX78_17785 [Candidatus Poribacteria bacterium]|nr:hypothetical protein [Candidatus Poribacteria bacterium]
MKKGTLALLLVVSIISGLVGGITSKFIFDGKSAIAQEETSIQAQDFRLVSKDGKVKAALSISPDTGEPFLIINGKDEKYRLMLNLDRDSPQIILRDDKAQTRLVIGTTEITNRLKGTIERRPESSLVMFNKDGKLIWSAP